MSTIDVVPFVDEGLGNSAYLVDLGDGRAMVVDVSLDLRATLHAAQRRGLTMAFAADTHLHADFLSGARQLSSAEGTRVLASATGHREFTHSGLRDGDEVDLGGLRLRALGTPGHTHEHLSFLLLDSDRPIGVFTGGSLLVGSAARTDLVSPEQTEALARAQYASLQRLAALPDEVAVWPTHGAGSFCSAPPGTDRVSTIGEEKATNPLLNAEDEDSFVAALLGSLGSFPPYFLRLGEINRRGPAILDRTPELAALDVVSVRAMLAEGAQLVDVRPVPEFAAAHVPGALSIPLRPVFASWLGWLAPHDRSLIILRGPDQDPAEIVWQATKIGYTNLVGELTGGIDAWTVAGDATTTTRLVGPDEVAGPVLDIRQTPEFAAGHLPDALHLELGDLLRRADEVPSEPLVVMCGHGERAMGAASLLEQAGHRDLAVLTGGPEDWAAATGRHLETGL
ncbi:glyoxylase-like metal-dependent hydrolase (beta-lactamase superfamily II)/rhodanese-related sulfurtransferase [Amycolatopsis bartoniae]|uniref:MBL fold metallo-hydrolase n=1 Tax=Amycolatopsis bartoniae TaxID=941986 RepID=A0A8H9IUN6_9PSEU|nr:MBL fold metallo-hydrolase [Amycolatopsis bartoniae]MBB2939967.1 glyoxylase-like metal-dependent hydrolase (beta-lactamase superfamily II)/rhodanese-related sulfurtransferase [Amycolatopsis bartoniae]TVT10140.1 MBL fold metallo-hydrolase [Amycolatopsis bartoniae]GHF35423.1 MBL fold metallo-hydrolase [Amycolatopsis bartoniae]